MFYSQVNIQNFRGIESLKINELKQVNLFTGRNNCGKTSVLEAIFLLTGLSNPQLAYNIHTLRGLLLTDDDDFNYIFNNFNFKNIPSISGKLGSQLRTLEIKPTHRTSSNLPNRSKKKKQLPSDQMISTSSGTDRIIDGINYNFQINGKKKFQSKLSLVKGQGTIASNYIEKTGAIFLNNTTILSDLGDRFDTLLVKKELDGVISALKEIEPNLIDIRMGSKGMVYVDIGGDKLAPINVMGDGVRRILAVLAAISRRRGGILFIDEIENGLHYKTLGVLWRAVLKAAIENEVQVFATTHSYECVTSFAKAYDTYLEASGGHNNETISLFRVEKTKKGEHRAFHYNAETLTAGIVNDFEVR